MKYKFVIPLSPVSKKNARPIFKNKKIGKTFLGKNTRLTQYEENLNTVIVPQKNIQGIKEPLCGNLKWRCTFKSKGKCRLDMDNILAGIFDAMQKAGVVSNDACFRFSDHFLVIDETGLPDETVFYIDPM